MMSNYLKLDDFDIYWAKELIFTQIRNTMIFIKNHHTVIKNVPAFKLLEPNSIDSGL